MDTGEGATFGPGLPLVEAVVMVAAADPREPPVCWGLLWQLVLVAVYHGSHGLVSCGVRWHGLVLGWPGGLGCIGLTLLVRVRQWLWLEVVRALSSPQLAWWRGSRCVDHSPCWSGLRSGW